jgi:hypothetical protein
MVVAIQFNSDMLQPVVETLKPCVQVRVVFTPHMSVRGRTNE